MNRIRKNFGKIHKIVGIPDLIGMQRDSYQRFLQLDTPPEVREDTGLQAVFKSVFPIKDFAGTASLEFVSYRFGEVKHDEEECIQRGMTYELPIRITIRLVVYDVDKESGGSNIRDIKEQEIYFGTIPLMTRKGTFIINGTERVVVSQLHRSSGVFFDHDRGKTHAGKVIYSSRIIPVRGSWIDMEIDPKDIIYIRIDRRRKFPVTLLLKAFGYTTEDLLTYFYKTEKIVIVKEPDTENPENEKEPVSLSSEDGDGEEVDIIPEKKITLLNLFPSFRFFKEFDNLTHSWETLQGKRAAKDITDPATGELIVKAGRTFTRRAVRQIKNADIRRIPVFLSDIIGCFFATSVIHPETGEVLAKPNDMAHDESLTKIFQAGITEFELLHIDTLSGSDSIRKTLVSDKTDSREDAVLEIYRRMRPGNPATSEVSQDFLDSAFFKSSTYDLSGVGRMKINLRLGLNTPVHVTTLRKEDILMTIRTLVDLRDTQGPVDDIDHLGNRRVRAVGELLENQYRIGLVRMERAIRERMSLHEVDALMPHDLVNSKPVSAVVREFFGTSQLSQFMDQTNPLSETTHKRRLSALGPGGLTRERAGFEVRDVHPSHYGRICPIETPEGPNIGLIVSLSTYARVNEFGFIETPYRVVKDAQVTNDVRFMSAFQEKKHPIAQANAPINTEGKYINAMVTSRVEGELMMTAREDVEYMDVSPNQLVSVSASLIPFLENDDANRALMGSNMQRQAVPLLTTKAPLVGTGIEGVVAKDSGVTMVAKRDGVVAETEASRILLRYDISSRFKITDRALFMLRQEGIPAYILSRMESLKSLPHTDAELLWQRASECIGTESADRYKSLVLKHADDPPESFVESFNLLKFKRSNQNTCFNQRLTVKKGQRVKAGDIIADGPATENGELALGKNIMVAFMPWGGYNFEDSILVSESLVQEGAYTSIHIEEFEVIARDTKLGKEDITRDIPNVGDDALKDLDESGIVRLGAEVRAGDILVGKVTPKGETQLSPEEKLLRAIFGEKAGDVKDTSLRVPPGIEGTVIDCQVFSRRGIDKDDRTRFIEDKEIARYEKNRDDELRVLDGLARYEISKVLFPGEIISRKILKIAGASTEVPQLKGEEITPENAEHFSLTLWESVILEETGISDQIRDILTIYKNQRKKCQEKFEERVKRYEVGDDLPPGVIKLVKVYVAMKRNLSVGDKMAGRHGNKGVVSRIVPQEDMPFFEDGKPLEMVLNPLGVPSRMNVGQILEIHLGRAARGLGDQINRLTEENKIDDLREKMKRIFRGQPEISPDLMSDKEISDFASFYKKGVHMATPVFDGAKESEIKEMLEEAGVSRTGQAILYDGRTGEPFDDPVTVGIMYMLKLHHLVDDKIHARSIGPYSLVTQQPLGGKAQFGGQRLGEMEVWAMEAYGSAYSLQEFLTVKSDDMAGRTRMYEKIVKGQNVLEPGIPESFKVLTKELQALGLDVILTEE